MEEIKNSKTSFFSAVKGCCLGIDIFKQLKNQKVFRIIFHLFVLSGLCSALILILSANRISKDIKGKFDIFESYTGGLSYQDSGVYPVKNPEKSFDFLLSSNVKVVYLPESQKLDLSQALETGITYYWLPKGIFAIGMGGNDNAYSIMFIDNIKNIDVALPKNSAELNSFIDKNLALCKDNNYANMPQITFNMVKNLYQSSRFIGFWFQYFVMLIFISLFFAFFYFITGVTKRSNMTFREFFAISIYAGFPPMMISAIFAGLELPFIQYNTVLSMGWLIYLLVILNSTLKSSLKNN